VRAPEHRRGADQHAARLGRLQAALERLDLLAQRRHLLQQRVVFKVLAVRVTVRPCLDRPALDQAVVGAAGRALRLLEQDQTAHEGAGVAAGVAQQGPAGRLVDHTVLQPMRVRLPGIVPAEVAIEVASGGVHLQAQRCDPGSALEHVQLRADHEHVFQRLRAPGLGRKSGVVQATGVTHAREQSPRLFLADRGDQVMAQRRERRRVQQHHAPLAQPDGAAVGLEAQQPAQVGVGRVGQVRVQKALRWWAVCLGRNLDIFRDDPPRRQVPTCRGELII
jgi:hypothetical protein